MYLVGAIGMTSSLLQSFKQFYNADERASDHKVISRQYSNFYRIRMQKFNWNIEKDLYNISLISNAFTKDLELIQSNLDCNINYNNYGLQFA